MTVAQRILNLQKNGNYEQARILESRPRCLFCGAIISDNNPDGIGYSCRKKLEEATILSFRNATNWEEKNPFFDIEVSWYVEWTENYLTQHKIRNKFYKEFIPSVLEQYKNKKYISKKQKEILFDFVFKKFVGYNPSDYAIDEFADVLQKQVKDKQLKFMEKWKSDHWNEIQELAKKLIFAKK